MALQMTQSVMQRFTKFEPCDVFHYELWAPANISVLSRPCDFDQWSIKCASSQYVVFQLSKG